MIFDIDISKPRYDQNTYLGRLKHFFQVTSPLNLFANNLELEEARRVVLAHKNKEEIEGLTEERLWDAKRLYDSAFHPDTGEKQPLIGRMSFQVPGNGLLTIGMLTFCRSTGAIVFWQWMNQSFNAVVNFTNRSGNSEITTNELMSAYFGATSVAVSTAVGLRKLTTSLHPAVARFIPFVAVAAGNCINIPMMRNKEWMTGTEIYSEKNDQFGVSTSAARSAIVQVIFSRILMATPGLVFPPTLITILKNKIPSMDPKKEMITQVIIILLCLSIATPMCCAIFPQTSSMKVSDIESPLKEEILKKPTMNPNSLVYFNKGL